MPSSYSGNPSTVTTSLAATIIGATGNTVSPIVLQTSAPHLYSTGDLVDIAAVGGNTAANGEWVITVVDATHFSLTGPTSTGNGAYTSGGTATNLSLTPAAQLPSDGDDEGAATVNVPFQALLDRTQYLVRRAPRVFQSGVTSVGTSYWSAEGWGASNFFDTSRSQQLSLVRASAGDLVKIELSTSLLLNAPATAGSYEGLIRLEYTLDGGTPLVIPGALVSLSRSDMPSAGSLIVPAAIATSILLTDGPHLVGVNVNGCVPVSAAAGSTLYAINAYSLVVSVFRAK